MNRLGGLLYRTNINNYRVGLVNTGIYKTNLAVRYQGFGFFARKQNLKIVVEEKSSRIKVCNAEPNSKTQIAKNTTVATKIEIVPLLTNEYKIRIRKIRSLIELCFFPENYPASVSKEYSGFMKWTFVHNVLGSAAGVLSMQSMLFAIGLGSSAVPLSATLSWVIKDGVGQLGGVIYASVLGSRFDKETKSLKLWSSVWLQSAIWLEMLTPMFPGLFVFVASFANIVKNISYLAMSATKASINKSLCLQDNLGDITAKNGSQATAAGLVGTILGIGASAIVGANVGNLALLFVPISAVSVWANYKSVKLVELKTLNLERTSLILEKSLFIDNGLLKLNNSCLKTSDAAKHESFLVKKKPTLKFANNSIRLLVCPKTNILLDISTNNALESTKNCTVLYNSFFSKNKKYYFTVTGTLPHKSTNSNFFQKWISKKSSSQNPTISVSLWFDTKSTESDKLEGIYNTFALCKLLEYEKFLQDGTMHNNPDRNASTSLKSMTEHSFMFTKASFPEFKKQLEDNGWNTKSIQFDNKKNEINVLVN
ncbi:hypothetical protein BB558_001043 [Smittium angustum]|nr:hypothetical protein BB558_001043 [Smittium angustum]